MKTSLIVGIIIGIGIVIIVSGFLYQETYNQNCIKDDGKVTGFLKCTRTFEDFSVPSNEYCAQLFDSSLESWSPPNPDYNPPTLAHIILGTPEFEEFRSSDCRFSVFDWANLSKNEDFIWNSNIQWPEFTQWYESELVYGVCGPDSAIQEDGYCYKDGKRTEFKNTEFELENKKCFNNYGNGTRIETSCEGIPFSHGPESFDIDSYELESEPTLEEVLESCASDSPKERMANILRYTNETHAFLNLDCKWKKIGEFPEVPRNEN